MSLEGGYGRIYQNFYPPEFCAIWYIVSGQGLHNSKSMYKVDLHMAMYDVSCHLKTF